MSSLAQLIPADFARRHLRTGRELVSARRRQPDDGRFTTGVESLDRVLGGGLRRGTMSELTGRGCGRFSAVLSALAVATGGGDAAALIDLGDGLDPQAAAAAGVVLERLLWVRPERLKEALASTEAILTTGMPLVIVDLGLPPVPGGRGAEASWLRLARNAQEQRTALLVSSPYRVSGTAAHSVVELRPWRAAWTGRGEQPRLLAGAAGRLRLLKGPGWHEAEPADLELRVTSPVAPSSGVGTKAKAPTKTATKTATPRPTAQTTTPRPATQTRAMPEAPLPRRARRAIA